MSVFKAKMHQSRFRLGLHPRPRWSSYSVPQTPYVFKGPTSNGREGKGKGKGMGGKGKGREGKGKGKRMGVEGDGLQPPPRPMRNTGYATERSLAVWDIRVCGYKIYE